MYNYFNYNPKDYMIPAGIQINQNIPMVGPYNSEVASPYEGFIRGNMFPQLYHPYYANEPFPLNPENEREALLNKLRAYEFATIDLSLYLDVYPENTEMIKLFNQYRSLEKQTLEEFQSKYGPITLESEALNACPWKWVTTPWPWEVK